MRIEPIGISFGYYTNPYTSGATRGAARTAMADMLQGDVSSVRPVDDVPEVFSNDEVDRVVRTPEEMQADRRNAYEVMNSLTPRNAEHLNPALEFMTNPPFTGSELPGTEGVSPEEEINLPGDGKPAEGVEEDHECETCANRTYVDGSNESDVSFKTAAHIAPEAAASTVRAHEYEHVRNAYQEDSKEGKELLSVSVSLKTAICPECGKTYVAGGKTRTLMRTENPYAKQQEAYNDFATGKAKGIDTAA